MNDVFIDCGHTEIEVVDPDSIIKSAAPEKKHSVRFATSPNNWVTVPLTDAELRDLHQKLCDRLFGEIVMDDEL